MTIEAVTNVNGSKYSIIGSPSGNYLSTVETDATLTGNGTGTSNQSGNDVFVNQGGNGVLNNDPNFFQNYQGANGASIAGKLL